MTDYDLKNFKTMMENAMDKLAGYDIIEYFKI